LGKKPLSFFLRKLKNKALYGGFLSNSCEVSVLLALFQGIRFCED